MIKLTDILEAVKEKFSKDHFQAEPAPFKKPKDESEKHNSTYHQTEPVPFKKPEEVSHKDDDKMPKAEKDQQDVLDRMEKQARYANPSSTDFYKQLRDTFTSAVNEMSETELDEDSVLGAGMSKAAKAADTAESDRDYIKRRQEREKKKSNSETSNGGQ